VANLTNSKAAKHTPSQSANLFWDQVIKNESVDSIEIIFPFFAIYVFW